MGLADLSPEQVLERLVSIKSLSGAEDEAATFVVDLLTAWGAEPQRQGNNVWAEIGNDGPRILFNSHLDTVPPSEGWNSDPWTPTWDGDKLIGLGSNDAKGCGTAMLFAFRSFLTGERELNGRLTILLSAEEEDGGANGIQSVLPGLGVFDVGFCGEPTGLRVCVAQRGMLLIRCVSEGVSGHVAHSQVGVNAIHKAARDISRLEAMRFEPHAALGETRAQTTTISGGLARNQIPDRCEFFVDFRTTPNLDHDELSSRVRAELESETIVHSERYHPKSIEPGHPLVRAALSVAKSPEPIGSATVSDWAFFGDIPAIKVGPGDTLRSHTPNEFLMRNELLDGVRFYGEAVAAYWKENSHV